MESWFLDESAFKQSRNAVGVKKRIKNLEENGEKNTGEVGQSTEKRAVGGGRKEELKTKKRMGEEERVESSKTSVAHGTRPQRAASGVNMKGLEST